MADDLITRLLIEQRKRLVASVMSGAEQTAWWSKLAPPEQRAFREKVLNSVGVFYDFCRDVVKVGNENSMVNEHAIELLQSVRESQRRLEQATRQ